MSGVNSLIPLSAAFASPRGPEQMQNMLAANREAIVQNQQQQQVNALRQVFQQPDAIGPDGLPTGNAIAQTFKIDPNIGLKLTQNVAQTQQTRAVTQGKQADFNESFRSSALDVGAAALSAYDDALKGGMPEDAARAQAQRVYSDGFKSLATAGYSPSMLGQLSPQFDPVRARANLAQDPRRVQLQQGADRLEIERENARNNTRKTDAALTTPARMTEDDVQAIARAKIDSLKYERTISGNNVMI
jgi:hypothetical protein